jgi:hypothetical protein
VPSPGMWPQGRDLIPGEGTATLLPTLAKATVGASSLLSAMGSMSSLDTETPT